MSPMIDWTCGYLFFNLRCFMASLEKTVILQSHSSSVARLTIAVPRVPHPPVKRTWPVIIASSFHCASLGNIIEAMRKGGSVLFQLSGPDNLSHNLNYISKRNTRIGRAFALPID